MKIRDGLAEAGIEVPQAAARTDRARSVAAGSSRNWARPPATTTYLDELVDVVRAQAGRPG